MSNKKDFGIEKSNLDFHKLYKSSHVIKTAVDHVVKEFVGCSLHSKTMNEETKETPGCLIIVCSMCESPINYMSKNEMERIYSKELMKNISNLTNRELGIIRLSRNGTILSYKASMELEGRQNKNSSYRRNDNLSVICLKDGKMKMTIEKESYFDNFYYGAVVDYCEHESCFERIKEFFNL